MVDLLPLTPRAYSGRRENKDILDTDEGLAGAARDYNASRTCISIGMHFAF